MGIGKTLGFGLVGLASLVSAPEAQAVSTGSGIGVEISTEDYKPRTLPITFRDRVHNIKRQSEEGLEFYKELYDKRIKTAERYLSDIIPKLKDLSLRERSEMRRSWEKESSKAYALYGVASHELDRRAKERAEKSDK